MSLERLSSRGFNEKAAPRFVARAHIGLWIRKTGTDLLESGQQGISLPGTRERLRPLAAACSWNVP